MIAQRFEPDFPLDELEEHPDNPRRGDVELISSSIEHNDFYGAVLVQSSTRRVVAGNHRLKAMRALGRTTIPAIVADLDDDQARRILLIDNRANDLARYDDADLSALLTQLAQTDAGLLGTGYADVDLADILERLNPPSLEDLGREYGGLNDDDHLVTVTLKLAPDVAARFRDCLDGFADGLEVDTPTGRVAALLDHIAASV